MDSQPSENQLNINQPVQSAAAPQVPQTPQVEASLPGVGALLKSSWEIYKKRFWVLIGIESLVLAVFLVVALVMMGFAGFSNILHPSGFSWTTVLYATLFLVIAFLGASVFYPALYIAIRDSDEGIGIKESFNRGWKKALSFIWLLVLLGLTFFGGFMMFIIPGFVFYVWFSVALIVFIMEGLRGDEALVRSREYVRGRWWSVAWRLLFITLIQLIASWILRSLLPKTTGSIAVYVLDILFVPLSIIYLFVLYKGLKDTRGNLFRKPVSRKRGILVVAQVLGLVAALAIPVIALMVVGLNSLIKNAKPQVNMNQFEGWSRFTTSSSSK